MLSLGQRGTVSQIAMSAMDDSGGEIAEHGVPALVFIEGLTMVQLFAPYRYIIERGRVERCRTQSRKKEIIKMWYIAHFTAVCYNKLQPKKL